MNRKITFYNQIDYLTEAEQALCYIAEDKKEFQEFRELVLRKYGADSEHIKNCLALQENIHNRMDSIFESRMEQVRALFGEIENRLIPAELILCWDFLVPANSAVYKNTGELRNIYQNLTPEQKDAYFFKALNRNTEEDSFERYIGNENKGIHKSDAERICNIFSYIQAMEIRQESKLRIQEIYLKRDMYFEQVLKLIDETIIILKEYEDSMQRLLKIWEIYWKQIIDEGSFFEKIKYIFEADDNMMENGFCVIPSFMQPAALLVYVNDNLIPKKKKYMLTCRIGVMLTDKLNLNSTIKEEFRTDEMVPVWKALGDKSKFDILLYIKDRPAYGSEIARHFSLTTATVSHHMNKLLQLRLVQADLKDGKLYYQVRKDIIQEFFESARKMFL